MKPLGACYILYEKTFVRNVFRWLAPSSKRSCARVCKVWRSVGNESLWSSVNFSVFASLGPVHYSNGSLHFNGVITLVDWIRFREWSSLVITFECDSYRRGPRACQSTLRRLDRCPFPTIFPNLRVLRLDVCMVNHAVLSTSVIDFTLLVNRGAIENGVDLTRRSIASLSRCLPNIESLRIDGDGTLIDFHAELMDFCRRLPCLQKLVLAPALVTSSAVTILSGLRHIRSIRVAEFGLTLRGHPDAEDVPGIKRHPALSAGAFPRLTQLSVIMSSIESTVMLLRDPQFVGFGLSDLWIRVASSSTVRSSDVRGLFRTIQRECPLLQRLVVRMAPMEGSSGITTDVRVIQSTDIEAIFDFPELAEFSFDHAFPLSMDVKAAASFARRASRFRVLWLNPFAATPAGQDLPIECLTLFAEHCPVLEKLGLHLNGQGYRVFPRSTARFEALQELFVGWSKLSPCAWETTRAADPGWESIAQFLSILLPPATVVSTLLDYSFQNIYDVTSSDMRCSAWLQGDLKRVAISASLSWKGVTAFARLLYYCSAPRGYFLAPAYPAYLEMHNALRIVELLERILSFVDDSSTASVVFVCTMWYDYGMQFLWEDVDARIFTVLGAAQIINNRITLMSDLYLLITHPMWNRFVKNCRLVRSFTNVNPHRYSLSWSSQMDIHRALRGSQLFPNLRCLALKYDCFSSIFMGPSVRHFYMHLNPYPTTVSSTILSDIDDIVDNMPRLSELSVVSSSLQVEHEEPIADLCSRLSYLRSVHLPRHALSPVIFNALATIPEVSSISANDDKPVGDSFFIGDRRNSLRWTAGSVQSLLMLWSKVGSSLTSLAFTLPNIRTSCVFFGHPRSPFRHLLTLNLIIGYPSSTRREDVKRLFAVIATGCPFTTSLTVSMRHGFRQAVDLGSVQHMDYDTLTPIFDMHDLLSFIVEHSYPIEMTDADVERFARALPQLQELSLNRHPLVLYASNMSISAISSVTRWCPDMEKLSLYMDGRTTVGSLRSLHCGRKLKRLNVGASFFPLESGPDAWMFLIAGLSFQIPVDCDMDTGYADRIFDGKNFLALANRTVFVPLPNDLLLRHHEGWCAVFSLSKSCQRFGMTSTFD